jgi:glycoside/pentoside/hexuronide:cation symporter, GPH family
LSDKAGRSRLTLIALAAPALPMAALTLPLTTFVPQHYARVVGINLTTVGAVFMLIRLFDIALDPLLGTAMDRTRTRWGRFKPWLAGGVPLVMIGVGMLFFPSPGGSPAYLATAIVITYVGYSIVTLSQLGLAAGLSTDYDGRSRVFTWWQAGTTTGLVLALVLATLLGGKGADTSHAVHAMGMMVLICTPIGAAAALFRIRDQTAPSPSHNVGMMPYLRLLRNPSTARLLGLELLLGLAVGIGSASAILFFLSVKLISVSQYSFAMLWYFVVAIVSAPLCPLLARRLQKHRALMAAACCYVAYMIAQSSGAPGHMTLILVGATIGGAAYTAASMLPRAMMADIGDEELLRTGVDNTGMLYALLIGTYKIGQAVAIGIVFPALDFIGYDVAAGRHNTPEALFGLTMVFVGGPTALSSLSALLMIGYPLTAKRHAQIREALEGEGLRHGGSEPGANLHAERHRATCPGSQTDSGADSGRMAS